MSQKRFEHGGNLDEAMRQYGGAPGDWLDLSTGINRAPYRVDASFLEDLTALPTQAQIHGLCAAAQSAFGTDAPIVAMAGVQSAIEILPRLWSPSDMAYLWPSYNEYPKSFQRLGWECRQAADLSQLEGTEVAILVNPNNPTGERFDLEDVLALAGKTGRLIVDESFMDADHEASIASRLDQVDNVLLLRSFGKFYGLAGLRLGFAMGGEALIDALRGALGPWPVSTLACGVGLRALNDVQWQDATREQLAHDVARMDRLVRGVGWRLEGGTPLFRLYDVGDAAHVQARLAGRYVWSRKFSYNEHWLRLGLPGNEAEWAQFEGALGDLRV